MEHERKIEKLLRAFARKRRADADDLPGLHPAARRMLQAEVAKQFSEAADETDSISLWQLFRQRWAVLLGFALLIFFCASMFLPALSKAKSRSQSFAAVNNLRQIGVAAQMAANENSGKMPATLDALTNGYLAAQVLTDPVTGKRFVYVAGGEKLGELQSSSILAYSPAGKKGRAVLFADGSVQMMGDQQFAERSRSGLLQHNAMPELAVNRAVPFAASAESNRAPVAAAIPEPNYPIAAAAPSAPDSAVVAMNATNFADAGPWAGGKLEGARKESGSAMEPNDKLAWAKSRTLFKSTDAMQALSSNVKNSSQKFVQALPMSADAKAPPVLASFEVQQNGNAVTVVDRDGSIYNGFVSPDSSGFQNAGTAAPAPVQLIGGPSSRTEPMQIQNNYNFRVEGQNRTLKQNVVFTGDLIPLPGTNAVTQSSLIFNARITGTATVDATNQIKINAVPASP